MMAGIAVFLCVLGSAQAKYSGGTGQPNNPYRIATANDLNDIGNHAEDFNKCFVMVNDINLAAYDGNTFNIIGPNQSEPFIGVFDGSGHSIFNFTYECDKGDYIALFGVVGEWPTPHTNNGHIRNVRLLNPSVAANASNRVGTMVGYLRDGTLENCVGQNVSIIADESVGGLVGYVMCGAVRNCDIQGGSVQANVSVGGLIGKFYSNCVNPIVADCRAYCTVAGTTEKAGGLIGYQYIVGLHNCYSSGLVFGGDDVGGLMGYDLDGEVIDSYSSSDVYGNTRVGGLVGCINVYNSYQADYLVLRCYAVGSVYGNSLVGGVLGHQPPEYSMIEASFWDVNTTGQTTSDGGMGLTTAQMQMESTFTDAGWDFNDVWRICEGQWYPQLAWEKYAGGLGTASEPYQIRTYCDLYALADDVNDYNKCFIMTADIDLDPCLSGRRTLTTALIAPDIDNSYDDFDGTSFTGVFDGNDHKFTNLTINGGANDYLGLFGCIGNGRVRNVTLEGGSVGGDYYVGVLTGANRWGGDVSNCHSTGDVSGFVSVGGLVGDNERSTISNCYCTGDVNGVEEVGGLLGKNNDLASLSDSYSAGGVNGDLYVGGLVGENYGTISNCSSAGNVDGTTKSVGGLVGGSWGGPVSNCYSTANVIGGERVGGLAGFNNHNIANCYSAGAVTGSVDVGGLVGDSGLGGTVTNTFWDLNTSSQATSAGGIGKTTAEMQTESTFTDAGWDFNDVWAICEGTNYPRHIWSIPAADFLCPDGVNFIDYSFFADWWLDDNCADVNDCEGADIDSSGAVNGDDLKALCDYWLEGL